MQSTLDFGLAGAKVAGVLFLLLGCLILGFYLLKKFGPKAGLQFVSDYEFKILGQFNLGPKKKLVMVRFLNRLLLLGVTDKEISLIAESEAEHAENDKQFSKKLYKYSQMESGTGDVDPPGNSNSNKSG